MASKEPKERAGAASGEGFEALYKRLEETVARLEQGNLSLEESLTLYEEGMKLARQCQGLLQDAELRISRLQTEFSEGFSALREDSPKYGEAEPEYDDEEVGLPAE
jgi:exodeoxyribonuclease VII small subunit